MTAPTVTPQQKRYIPQIGESLGMVGKQWVDRPMVPYCGSPDDTQLKIEPDDFGSDTLGSRVEWHPNIADLKKAAENLAEGLRW